MRGGVTVTHGRSRQESGPAPVIITIVLALLAASAAWHFLFSADARSGHPAPRERAAPAEPAP